MILVKYLRNSRLNNLMMPILLPNSAHSMSVWSRALLDAEKIVGYPTSFIGLRSFLSDEVSNIAVYLKKLIGTGHPLITTAKKLIYGENELAQTRGLVVLLVAKAALPATNQSGDVLSCQRGLAEITELIHTALMIHEGVIELSAKDTNMEYGNKMAILCGDFLLAQACTRLATLQNTEVVELISKAISDMTAAEFCLGQANFASVSEIINAWKQKCLLRYGSLLANSCKSAVVLSKENSTYQDIAYLFGLHFAIAWQANIEISSLRSSLRGCQTFQGSSERLSSLGSLVKAAKIHEEDKDMSVENEATRLCNTYVNDTIAILSKFPESPARSALEKITQALYC